MPLHCSNGKKTTAFPATKETKDAKPVGCKQACSEQVRADPLLILRSNVMCTTDNVRRGKPTYLVPYTVPFKVPTPSLYLHCIYTPVPPDASFLCTGPSKAVLSGLRSGPRISSGH